MHLFLVFISFKITRHLRRPHLSIIGHEPPAGRDFIPLPLFHPGDPGWELEASMSFWLIKCDAHTVG